MLTVYVACLIFGGTLLAVTLSSGGDAHAGADVDTVDAHGDVGADGDLDHDAEGRLHGAASHADPRLVLLSQVLSVRNLIFFTAFFGAAGTALTLLRVPAWWAAPSSALMGSTAAVSISRVLAYLHRTESGRVDNEKDFEGLPARVLVDVGVAETGKISVATDERSLQLLARVAQESSRPRFAAGEAVLIVRVEDGIAQVAGEDFVS